MEPLNTLVAILIWVSVSSSSSAVSIGNGSSSTDNSSHMDVSNIGSSQSLHMFGKKNYLYSAKMVITYLFNINFR